MFEGVENVTADVQTWAAHFVICRKSTPLPMNGFISEFGEIGARVCAPLCPSGPVLRVSRELGAARVEGHWVKAIAVGWGLFGTCGLWEEVILFFLIT